MLFIFSTPVLIRNLWQLMTVVLMHRCLICVVLLRQSAITSSVVMSGVIMLSGMEPKNSLIVQGCLK